MKKSFKLIALTLFVLCCSISYGQIAWPEIMQQNKPWTRWWWMGNAVDTVNLGQLMEQYAHVGLGGLEIVPIYGVLGYEEKFLPYLGTDWLRMLEYTLAKAGKLEIGIDMANGTGWPFGGKWVQDKDASQYISYKSYDLSEGELVKEKIQYTTCYKKYAGIKNAVIDQVRESDHIKPFRVMAYNGSGISTDITALVDEQGNLNWKAPQGNWKVIALFRDNHGKMVERAAPGAEGYAIDHFSKSAINSYLQHFDTALVNTDINNLRCFFNDSYEVDDALGQADWTTDLPDEFNKRRGYDLYAYLPALLLQDTSELKERVTYDYRLTISELMLEYFTSAWHQWANDKGALIRNQAHGSPANILDLYAVSDIPETEGKEILRFKFASSAGNVMGKTLISAETATWLADHFLSTLSDVKKSVDTYFLGGVNHLIYHGTAYSPVNDPWPGWLFYAAVHFQPSNPFWNHFKALNSYVSHTQSFLQQGHADNDILLYYPIADRFSDPGDNLLRHFDRMDMEFKGTVFQEGAVQMLKMGYAFDYISDKQLQKLRFQDNLIQTDSSAYQTIVVPGCKYMPVETMQHLLKLAEAGACIIFLRNLPEEVPGLANYDKQSGDFTQMINGINFSQTIQQKIKQTSYGKGKIILGEGICDLLEFAEIRREPMVDSQIQFVRRKINNNSMYLLVNNSSAGYNGWLPVNCRASAVALFDALTGRKGLADFRKQKKGNMELYIQLKPSESIIIMAYPDTINDSRFEYIHIAGEPTTISGKWTVSFVEGGPVLPADIEISELTSWTGWVEPDLKRFSGTAKYSLQFKRPGDSARNYLLNLGTVKESAGVWLNGIYICTMIGDDFSAIINGSLMKTDNLLEIRVANSMANRIIDMDQQGIPYKKFYNVNFPASISQNTGPDGLFTATYWEPIPSGLLGPVTLTPLQ